MRPKLPAISVRYLLLAVGVYFFSVGVLIGQTTFGTITGIARDSTGAVLPGVSVTVTNQATNIARTVVTGQEGSYTVPNLNAGTYTVAASLSSFKRFEHKDVLLQGVSTVRIDIQLELGDLTTEVVVEAGAPVVAEVPMLAQTRSFRELRDLPLNIRGLEPMYKWIWVTPTGIQGGGSRRTFGGARSSFTYFNVDGLDSNSPAFGNQLGDLNPQQEAIEEVRFEYSGAKAEFAESANVTAITKSGGNQFHGTAFGYNVHSALSSRSFFATTRDPVDPLTGQQQHSQNNQVGFSLGGPIRRDKIFFFSAYENSLDRRPVLQNASVPTLKMRQGDFSELLERPSPIVVRNPFTGAAFAGNLIPSNLLYPGSVQWQESFIPKPNFGDAAGFNQNYRNAFRRSDNFNQTTNRVDAQLSQRHSLYVRMHHLWVDIYAPQGIDPALVGYLDDLRTGTQFLVSDTFTFSPNVVNELKIGYAQRHLHPNGNALNSLDTVQLLGLQGLPNLQPGHNIIPSISIASFSGINQGQEDTLEFSYHISNDITWTRGSHTFKMGGRFFPKGRNSPQYADFGSYTFQNNFSGFSYANFLLGLPVQTSVEELRDTLRQRFYWLGAYFQDDFKVTPRLTLNVGVRWDYNRPPYDAGDIYAGFDPSTGNVVVPNEQTPISPRWPANLPVMTAAQAGVPERGLRHSDMNNYAPRFGFAWRPSNDSQTVFRGSYGVFFDALTADVAGGNFSSGVIRLSESYTNQIVGGTPLLTLQRPFLPLGTGNIGAINISFADPNLVNPYLQQWNLTLEKDIGFATSLRIRYLVTKATQVIYQRNINQPAASLEPFNQNRRPFPRYQNVVMRGNGGSQNYNALEINLERRLRAGLHFQANWVLAKNVGNVDDDGGVESGTLIENQFDLAAERGNARYTPRHRGIFNLMWELPWGEGKPWLNQGGLKHVFGDWVLTGNILTQTGEFLTPSFAGGRDPSNTNTIGGRPDRICDGNLPKSERTLQRWFDTSCFVVPANGRFGNAGKGILEGPGRFVLNLGLFKRYAISEGKWLRFQAMATNVLNRANFAVPNTNISDTNVGIVSNIYSTSDFAGAREIMLGVRLEF
jgi:hypothetical protein